MYHSLAPPTFLLPPAEEIADNDASDSFSLKGKKKNSFTRRQQQLGGYSEPATSEGRLRRALSASGSLCSEQSCLFGLLLLPLSASSSSSTSSDSPTSPTSPPPPSSSFVPAELAQDAISGQFRTKQKKKENPCCKCRCHQEKIEEEEANKKHLWSTSPRPVLEPVRPTSFLSPWTGDLPFFEPRPEPKVIRLPLELRLMQRAHSFIALRAQGKWEEVLDMCTAKYRNDGVSALLNRHCFTLLSRALKHLVSLKAMNLTTTQEEGSHLVALSRMPYVLCEFGGKGFNYSERIYFVSCPHNNNNNDDDDHEERLLLLVQDVVSEGDLPLTLTSPGVTSSNSETMQAHQLHERRFGGYMTSLILIGYALQFAAADAAADFDCHEEMLADMVEAHGVKGKEKQNVEKNVEE